jgi:hypothetical protein
VAPDNRQSICAGAGRQSSKAKAAVERRYAKNGKPAKRGLRQVNDLLLPREERITEMQRRDCVLVDAFANAVATADTNAHGSAWSRCGTQACGRMSSEGVDGALGHACVR